MATLNSSPSSLTVFAHSGEAEAPREIPARGSAGAALNLRDCPLLPGSGVRALVSLSFGGSAA